MHAVLHFNKYSLKESFSIVSNFTSKENLPQLKERNSSRDNIISNICRAILFGWADESTSETITTLLQFNWSTWQLHAIINFTINQAEHEERTLVAAQNA